MQKVIDLLEKEKKYVVGLMSGTSLDGVDAALVEIEGSWIETKINLLGFIEFSFPAGLKECLLNNSARVTSNVEEICRLNFLLPNIYANAVEELCAQTDFPIEKIDLIGTHGQTIQHLPEKKEMFGFEISSTLQIGDPSVLSKLLNKIVVGDFRTADIAVGGQGAPLVPYFDYILFHSGERNRALLNIGGISNITLLKKNGNQKDVLAFDTGPGNMMIDVLAKKLFDENFDADGKLARKGNFNEDLFNALVTKDNFIERKPPKSTGREYYGELFLEDLFEEFSDLPKQDWLNTVTNFTAYAIYRNYEKFIKDETPIDELFISGGGLKNKYLFESLHSYFGDSVQVKALDEIGISSDAKEAICFAVLANETINGNSSNIPRTTGAGRSTILGKICLP